MHIIVSTQIQPCINAWAREAAAGSRETRLICHHTQEARHECTKAICSGWVNRKIWSVACIPLYSVFLAFLISGQWQKNILWFWFELVSFLLMCTTVFLFYWYIHVNLCPLIIFSAADRISLNAMATCCSLKTIPQSWTKLLLCG